MRYTFASVLMQHPGVRRYRFTSSATSLTIRVVPVTQELSVEDFAPLTLGFANELGGELPVPVELVSAIAHERGKQRSVVSDVP